jgi:hypothetical protein
VIEPRESSIPGVPEWRRLERQEGRGFDTGEHMLVAARQIAELQEENRRLRALVARLADDIEAGGHPEYADEMRAEAAR